RTYPVPDDARAGTEIDIAAVFRHEHGRVFGALVRQLGDFDRAEDAIQDAFLVALQLWPKQGTPQKPAAWITTVARNAALSAHPPARPPPRASTRPPPRRQRSSRARTRPPGTRTSPTNASG